MKPGQASRTAVLVCMGRAAAHDRTPFPPFADPTAFALLPTDARARVERFRAGEPPLDLRERVERAYLSRQSPIMVVRTVAIDDAVREAASPQLVILGAGLDGRAWRMPELRNVVAFEVDHPDSQRDKQARVAGLVQTARDVRFVAVDFSRDDLDQALARAGHDPAQRTTWIWEGVVMYLTPAEVEATLSVIARRSAKKSRLIVLYHCPAIILRLIGLVVRRFGEPLRSRFTAEAMGRLLAIHGFVVARDDDVHNLAVAFSSELARIARVARHLRVAIADR